MVESLATPSMSQVAVVLAAHVVRGVGGLGRAKHRELGVLEGFGVAAGGRLHRGDREHLHQVVDDDVAQRPDRVVEVAAVLDAEASAIVICMQAMWLRFQIGSIIVLPKRR